MTGTAARGPLRRCIATGAVLPRAALLRFVVAADGAVAFDAGETLPGRGLWLSAKREAVDHAVARKLFAKAARRPARAAPELGAEVERQLASRCQEWVRRARRGGSSSTECGSAFDGEASAATAIGQGRLAERLRRDLARLNGFRRATEARQDSASLPLGDRSRHEGGSEVG